MPSAEEVRRKGEVSSACMLQQSMATVTGVGIGLALGLRAKSVKPFLLTSFLGTAADLGYGSLYACRELLEEFRECKTAFNAQENARIQRERATRES